MMLEKNALRFVSGIWLVIMTAMPLSAKATDWDELPKKTWGEFFERLDFKPKAIIVQPQIDFQFKQTLAKLLYAKGYKEKWVKAARNLKNIGFFLKYVDQRVNSKLGGTKAHLSFARMAEVKFMWKSPLFVSRKTYAEGKNLFIKHYDLAASKGSKIARTRLGQLLNMPIDNVGGPFEWLRYELVKKHRLEKTSHAKPVDIEALIKKEGAQAEKDTLSILKKYAN